ncbi:adenine deaminase [Gemmiger sp.]
MKPDVLKRQIAAGRGEISADLVLKNARIINVFTNEIEKGDVAICDGFIVGVGTYSGKKEVDLHGSYVCPGLIDGHIHIESSILCSPAFEQAVLPHGTTAIITDPHEISNVAGTDGLDFMLETTKDLTLSVYFMLPSCVPATDLDESGAVLDAEQLRPYYNNPHVLGLAELMNSYGTVRGDAKIMQKICDCTNAGKIVDGHAPFLSGSDLNAYITAGVQSDHECSTIEEAMEKLRRGQYIMVREGTAAKNMDALLPLFREPYCNRCMLVTDDKHPGDLLRGGHIDANIRKAIAAGVDPAIAVKMATLIPAQYFGLNRHSAVAPGYKADLIVVSDLEQFTVEQVYKNGTLAAEHGKMLNPSPLLIDRARFARVMDSFDMDEITLKDLALHESGENERVIRLIENELLTEEVIVPFRQYPSTAPGVDIAHKIVKLAVFERHHHSGHVGLGFLGNYSLQRGAVASSVAHDSHNLIVAGTNDADMVLAGNTVRKNKGGLAFVVNGQVIGELALPVAGLMSTESAEVVMEKVRFLKEALKAHGIAEGIDPFMTLAFVSLPVIPKLRLNTYGIVDVEKQKIVPAVF